MTVPRSREINRARIRFLLIMTVWCLWFGFAQSSKPQELFGEWPGEIRILHNPEGSPAPSMATLLEYAAWSWKERTGLPLRYAGTAGDDGFATSGWITIIWRDATWFHDQGHSMVQHGFTRTWYFVQSGTIAGSVITLNSTIFKGDKCDMMTVMHELGHALGIRGHSDNPHDVMYHTNHCRYTLSAADSDLLSPDTDSSCHAELTSEGHIYIPMIDGLAAYLIHNGDHTWTLRQLVPSRGSCSASSVVDVIDVVIRDLRSYNSQYHAELEWMGNDTWRLREVVSPGSDQTGNQSFSDQSLSCPSVSGVPDSANVRTTYQYRFCAP